MATLFHISQTFAGLLVILLVRYLIFSGGFFLLCWQWKREEWGPLRIDPALPAPEARKREVGWSLLTSVLFAASGTVLLTSWERGYTKIYLEPAKFGWGYLPFSLALLLFLHETYFYWTHRWMHHPRLFRHVHKVHHESRNPSPWAAFSFHPSEAVIQAVILPVLVCLVPVHPAVLLLFLMIMTVTGVINHNGYELYGKGFARHPVFRWVISATHHQRHHQAMNKNFGLYFTFWDHWRQTEDAGYADRYDAIQVRFKQM